MTKTSHGQGYPAARRRPPTPQGAEEWGRGSEPKLDTIYRGTAELPQLPAVRLYFSVALTGDLAASGRFFAVRSRPTVERSGDSYAGRCIFWIVDGRIAFPAYAQTA